MIKLTNFIKQSIFILSVSGIVVIATPTTQAQPFTKSDAPNYTCDSKTHIATVSSKKIDQFGNFKDPLLKLKILWALELRKFNGCKASCAPISLDIFSLLEDETVMRKEPDTLWVGVVSDPINGVENTISFMYEQLSNKFGTKVYSRGGMRKAKAFMELLKLPAGDHVIFTWIKEGLNEKGELIFTDGHATVVYKTMGGILRVFDPSHTPALFLANYGDGIFIPNNNYPNDDMIYTIIGINREIIGLNDLDEIPEIPPLDLTIPPDEQGGAGPGP